MFKTLTKACVCLGAATLLFSSSAAVADSDIAVIYYSRSGNTAETAQLVKELTDADLYQVSPEPDYPDEYRATVDVAKKELESNSYHDFKPLTVDFSKYQTIVLAAPTWWGHIPTALMKYLGTVAGDLAGKKVITFNSHAGSGISQTRADFEKLVPQANFGTHLCSSGAASKSEVEFWLKENGVR